MRVASILFSLLTSFSLIQALPVFEKPNDFDKQGRQCPLYPQNNLQCPVLCVTDHNLCPPSVAPTCPQGLQFCPDGTCQESCENIPNICLCNDNPSSSPLNHLLPCAATQLINITHFNPDMKELQTRNLCAANLNIPRASVGLYGYPNATSSDYVWAQCPEAPPPTFTFHEPMWIAVWTITALEAFILLGWHIYKTAREASFQKENARLQQLSTSSNRLGTENQFSSRNLDLINEKLMTASDDSVDDEKKLKKITEEVSTPSSSTATSENTLEFSSLKESERLRFRGFNRDYFGLIAFGSVCIVTILFMIFLGCLVGDTYGKLQAGEIYHVFLSSDLASKIFCAVWHIAAAWFCAVMVFRKRLRNYFRIESFPHLSSIIQVERQQEETVFLDDGNKWIAKLRAIEQYFVEKFHTNIVVETCPVNVTSNNLRYFEYQCMRYVYSSDKKRFEPYEFDLGSTNKKLRAWSNGIGTKEAVYRQELLGPNIIPVYVPSIPWAIVQEFSSLVYLYQMMCMWVWYYFNYYPMGLVQTCIILISAAIRIFLRLRAENRIKAMAEYVSNVTVYRDGRWQENMSSAELVPGDVFQVEEHATVPCDCALLSGAVVVNESALTGEAMPIRKFALPDDDNLYEIDGAGKANSLFAGTLVSQIMPALKNDGSGEPEPRVYALVLRTGISSDKGMLIHKILFPSPVSFIFDEHIKVAICILLIWGLVAFCLTLYLMGRGNITSWFYGIFVMSQIFSPLLPAAFTINQSVCATRLRKKQILCIDLPRINLSGKVRIFCFDKTGTLTKEGLEFYGAVSTKNAMTGSFGPREEDPLKIEPTLAMGIATCHAVTKVKDQFIGNPVDIESFHAMKWELLQPIENDYLDTLAAPIATPNDTRKKLVHVLRRFEFVHARASQSVAVLDPDTQRVHVFLKGSFERVKYLSDPRSIPSDYDQQAANYAQEGCYVLAMAHRDLGVLGKDIQMESIKSHMSRDDLEQDCQFIGFLLFRNMLKHDTTDAIAELKAGDTRTVMITGDTALTGIYIARQCGMIEPDNRVLLGDVVTVTHTTDNNNGGETVVNEVKLVWHDVDTGDQVDADQIIQMDPREENEKRVELALTGRAFEFLVKEDQIRKYLMMTRVFARMTPTDKVMCVQLHMEKGVTAMCGDGGNDCGALRAAHVGLALSEAEASIVSPFSTSNRTIMQCVELIKQGRAALATSFSNYKFLILYGECMAFWELLMFYFTVISPQSIWITIDGFITTTMTFAITQAKPAEKLSPSRPTAKPLGVYTLASLLGVIFINFWFLVCSVVWLFQQDWFICNEFDSRSVDPAKWWLLGDNFEAEVIALVVMFQFFNNGAVVNFGSQFRQSWWRNYVLVFVWCCFFVNASFLTLADPNPYSCIFRLNCGSKQTLMDLGYPEPNWNIDDYNSPVGHNVLPKDFRWKLWGYVVANCACSLIWERVCMLWIARDWAIKRRKAHPEKNRAVFKL